MVLPTVSVANYFIGKAQKEGVELTLMKLIKLVYIAHGWHLALKKRPLIGEQVQAWKFGPVVPSVYADFKDYGRAQIGRQKAVFNADGATIPVVSDAETLSVLDSVWSIYKRYTGGQLSTMTHQPNTPWDETWNKRGGSETFGFPIPDDLIQRHYEELGRKKH